MGIHALALIACLAASVAACSKGSESEQKPTGTTSRKVAPVQPPAQEESEDARMERARKLAHAYVIVDGHVNLPYRLIDGKDDKGNIAEDVSERTEKGQFDFVRAKEGGLDAPFMSIYVPARLQEAGGAKKLADELIDLVAGIATRHPDKFALARSPEEVRRNRAAGRVSLPLGIENGSAIEGNLVHLAHFFERGVRYITLTHSKDNRICDSSYDESRTHKGLSPFGKQVVAEMNRLGIMVDVSHVSDETFWQVMKLSKVPVIASHSSLRHFVPGFHRNMSDDMVKAMKNNGGVVMINFGSTFVDPVSNRQGTERGKAHTDYVEQHKLDLDNPGDEHKASEYMKSLPALKLADVAKVADHIERVVELAGIDHVGFGSDFDGVGPTLPVGLEDASRYPVLIAELLRRGFSEADIRKVCSDNVFRVWQAVLDHGKARQ